MVSSPGGTTESSTPGTSEVRDLRKKEETRRRVNTDWRRRANVTRDEKEDGRETKARGEEEESQEEVEEEDSLQGEVKSDCRHAAELEKSLRNAECGNVTCPI
ncbi:hypothetical protein NDU88_004383 [Pleurodeles waltl]|uniref:Uncharacterized protein n=1 Tax=Pleurodeles waltl TaxID=8319 RepID=A0AAV7RKT8_PLEWA|nr:hypothetical protein NDU88_004383 [Pleurodeles waltl]